MRGANTDMHRLLARHAAFVDAATLQGKLYRLDGYPAAVASEAVADRVQGELYRLLDPHYLLAQLDQYEECSPEFPDPTEYVRRRKKVSFADGQCVAAWVYLYNRPVENLQLIESGEFRRAPI